MATVSTTEVAGGTAFPFLGGRVWTPLNTTAVGAEDLTVTGSLTAENCELVVRRILNNTGTLDITNCVLDISFSGNSNAISGTWNMEDVLITSNITGYRAWGNWAGGAAVADYDWSNIVFACRVDTDGYLSYNSPFVPKLSATSTFANVSFVYRDRDGGSVGGVTPQLGGNQVWADASFGGFGLQLNTRTAGADNATDHVPTRVLLRISNQGNSNDGSTFANTQGWFINPDLRAFEAIDDTSLNCFILMDSSANSLWINPLMGQPTNSQFYGYVVAPAGGGPTWRMATVTNPSFTDANSVFTIPSTEVSEAFQVPATLANNGQVSDGAASNFNAQSIVNPTNGFGFITYAPTQPTALTDLSGWRYGQAVTDATRSRAIENVAERTYRHYSWIQQGADEEFGEARTISVPPFNATDAEIQTARDGGFDQLTVTGTTTGWATETDINTEEDTWVASKSALTTPALADAEYGVTGTGVVATERDGDDIAVMSKLIAWRSLEGGGINAANDKINLPHWSFGSALRFSTGLTFTSAASFPVASNPTGQTLTGLTFPATNITTTDQVTAIESTGNISLGGTFGSGSLANKVPLNSIGGNITASGAAYQDITLSGANVTLTGTTPTITDCSLIGTTEVDLNDASLTDSTVTGGDVINIRNLTDTTITGAVITFDDSNLTISGANVTGTGILTLPGSGTTYSNNTSLEGSQINNISTSLSDVTLTGTGAVDGGAAHTFTNLVINSVWNFTGTGTTRVHTFDNVVFNSLPTTSAGDVRFQLGAGDTVESTFGQATLPSGFVQVLPDLVITINNALSADTDFGDVFWALYNGTTREQEGSVTGASGTVTITAADISADTWQLAIVGNGYLDQRIPLILAEGNRTLSVSEDPSADTTTTPGTDISVTAGNNTTDTDFRINLPTGSASFGSRGLQNAGVTSLKSNQFYARFVGRTGVGISFAPNGDTIWYADSSFTAGIQIVASNPISVDAPAIQGARWDDGNSVTLYSLNPTGFVSAIINGLEQTGVTATTTTRLEGDSTIDLGAIGSTTQEALDDFHGGVGNDTQTTEIVGTGGESISGIKSDTETILDRTQIIIED